jgi:hypothetical protein
MRVTDVDDPQALYAKPPHDAEQRLRLGFAERRGGLVEDEHPRVEGESFGNLNDLLARDGQAAGQGIDRDWQKRRQHGLGASPHVGPINGKPPRRVDLCHEDVLGHGHVGAECDLLVDEADPSRCACAGLAG